MAKVVEPPFYAGKLEADLLTMCGGLRTDLETHVLDANDQPIEGLYVCGNDQGGFYPHNYPSNFTGINAGRTATFGRIAAKHALGVE